MPPPMTTGAPKYLVLSTMVSTSASPFADGAIGSWGAALIAPYNDDPDTRGLLRVSPETMHKLAEQFYEDHFQVVRAHLWSYFISFSREN
jgi:predicted amidohydrolase YtcJ